MIYHTIGYTELTLLRGLVRGFIVRASMRLLAGVNIFCPMRYRVLRLIFKAVVCALISGASTTQELVAKYKLSSAYR